MRLFKLCTIALAAYALSQSAMAQAPQYSIIDLGPSASDPNLANIYGVQGNAITSDGTAAVGRTLSSCSTGFCSVANVWTSAGMTALPDPSGTGYAIATSVASANLVAGTSYVGIRDNPLPVKWVNGVATQLALPSYAGGVGQATGINSSGVVVGSIGSGDQQQAQIWNADGTSMNVPYSASGVYMTTAMGINNAGLVIGSGIDLNNQARNAGVMYNMNTGVTTDIPLPSTSTVNGTLPFGVSSNGYVVGSADMNQAPVGAFIWSAATGTQMLPGIAGYENEIAYGVNSSGWVVGSVNTAYSNGFLYTGSGMYLLSSLITPAEVAAGWDFSTNTYASALGISDNGTIVGSAVFDGVVHGYELVLDPSAVPEPASYALLLGGLVLVGGVSRRRRSQAAQMTQMTQAD